MKQKTLLFLFTLLILSSPISAEENRLSDSGLHSFGGGSSSPNGKYEIAVIDAIQPDGTLLLTNGRKIKVSEADLANPSIRPQGEILIYTKSGIPRLDREGRMVGSIILLLTNGRNHNDSAEKQDAGLQSATQAILSHALAATSTLAPPLTLQTGPSSKDRSWIVEGELPMQDIFIHPEGEVSGSLSLPIKHPKPKKTAPVPSGSLR